MIDLPDIPPFGPRRQPGSWIMMLVLFAVVVGVGVLFIWLMRMTLS